MYTRGFPIAIALAFTTALSGCQSAADADAPGMARTDVDITATVDDREVVDAETLEPVIPAKPYDALRLEVEEITVRGPDGWYDVATRVGWVAVVESDDTTSVRVAETTLPEGEYDQIRLVLNDAEVDLDGRTMPITVPSGESSGLKIFDTFCLDEDRGVHDLDIVFDLQANLHETGTGELILHPAIDLRDEPDCEDWIEDDDTGDDSR